jgi:hypothetical protein
MESYGLAQEVADLDVCGVDSQVDVYEDRSLKSQKEVKLCQLTRPKNSARIIPTTNHTVYYYPTAIPNEA